MAKWIVVRRTEPQEGLFSWIEIVPDRSLNKIVLEYDYYGLRFLSYSPSNPKTALFDCSSTEAIDATRQFIEQISLTEQSMKKVVEFLKEHNITL